MQEWTEKYRPRSLSEVRGNDKSVGELREWAETWEEHREAALVVGEPGVGKTSAVHALASDMGWSVVEQNASDSRTKDAIMEVAGEAARSQSLGGRRTLVVLDEADNLHGNADRGGSKALSEVLREAVQPVVLIGNEEREISGSLKRQTRKIEFGNVGKRSIVPVLRDVLESEGVSYDTGALDVIAEENSGDLRGALNDLQASAEGRSHLGVDDVDATGSRDRSEEIWGFLDVVFKQDDVGHALRMARDLDESPEDLVHWIDEGMPKVYGDEELVEGYRWLSRADVYLGRTRKTQNYSLWRYASDAMVGGVQAAKTSSKGGWTRYGFPATWRKLGQSRGRRDTRDSIARKVARKTGTSMATAREQVFPYLSVLLESDSATEVARSLDLSADEVSYLTEMTEAEAQEVVEQSVEEVDGDDWDDWDEDDQSTLGSFG
ncbi:MAG: replication factor C large subunit [Halobacteriales archaeon]